MNLSNPSSKQQISHQRKQKELNSINSQEQFSQTRPWQMYYKMGKMIGKGAFSRVFEAFDIKTSRKFAIKEIPRHHFKYVTREIEIMRRVRHENILNCQEIFEDEFSIFLVLEYVGGGELYEKIEKHGRYTEAEAKEIIVQIIAAVDYLHQNKIAHRDLKPENILCLVADRPTKNGFRYERIKLADFGLSKEFTFENLHTKCGSPTYVAPELLQGKYDERVDFWAIGVITYILLTAYFPFYDENDVTELYKKICAVSYTFPANIPLSLEAKDFISKLIVGDPAKRMTPSDCWNHPWLKDAYCLQQYTTQSYSLLGSSMTSASEESSDSSSPSRRGSEPDEQTTQKAHEDDSSDSADSSDEDSAELDTTRDNNNDDDDDENDSILMD